MHKVKFETDVNLLISALHVDMQNAVEWVASKYKEPTAAASLESSQTEAAEPSQSPSEPPQRSELQGSQAQAGDAPKKPHPVAMLIPGFDVLQSGLSINTRSSRLDSQNQRQNQCPERLTVMSSCVRLRPVSPCARVTV